MRISPAIRYLKDVLSVLIAFFVYYNQFFGQTLARSSDRFHAELELRILCHA